MSDMILLYDSNDEKIGETYVRRAKQLVKQQRAEWTDESQKALRFFAGAENTVDEPPAAPVSGDDDALIALARKRLNERKWFIINTLAFLPGWLLLVIFYSDGWQHEAMFFGGAWTMFYAVHFWQFAVPRLKKLCFFGVPHEERKARALAAEVAKLKAELNA